MHLVAQTRNGMFATHPIEVAMKAACMLGRDSIIASHIVLNSVAEEIRQDPGREIMRDMLGTLIQYEESVGALCEEQLEMRARAEEYLKNWEWEGGEPESE